MAGVEIAGEKPGDWIRPVSDREHQEVSEEERRYENGSYPELLDVIDVPLLEHQPDDHQQENWILDPEYYWEKVGVFCWDDLHKIAERGGTLWRNGISTPNGENDRIPTGQASAETSSLKLVHVDGLRLKVFAPYHSKRRVQACFQFDEIEYALWVTDPRCERKFLAKENGDYQLDECYLTVSLGEPYDGYCCKLVAAALEKQ